MKYELIINNNGKYYSPSIVDEVIWETERKGIPGKLTFKMVKDKNVFFEEGNPVRFTMDDKKIFYGFIFTMRQDKQGIVTVTAYDQLRYLKNKEMYNYENKTATEVIQMIAGDFNLQCGTLENTQFKIESKVEDTQTLFDIIQNALELTKLNKREIYVLYDDFGKLTLKNIANMKLNILIDDEAAEDFEYTSTIDTNTYNQIKLYYENEEAGYRNWYIAKSTDSQNKWGILQFVESINNENIAKEMAESLLKLYNKKTKNLSFKQVFGHPDVRAGSLIGVSLNLGDVKINNFMLVESCSHKFTENRHTMDLKLNGGMFYA